MQTMQEILCRGAVDRAFLGLLLAAPREALREYEYDLGPAEYAVLAETPARSLTDLAAAVEAWRRGDLVTLPARELALAS